MKSALSPVSRISRKFIDGWIRTSTFATNTRAREAQADKYFREIITLADKATPETVNVVRLQVDSRKFAVARLAPKKYGDQITHDIKGGGNILQAAISVTVDGRPIDERLEDQSTSEASGSVLIEGNGDIVRRSSGRG